jgi:hypothetical protein
MSHPIAVKARRASATNIGGTQVNGAGPLLPRSKGI